MQYRQLGRSDLMVSEISLGSWLTYGVGVEAERATACVRRAFEVGINFFDTANVYGRGAAESFLGEVLAGRRPVVATSWPPRPSSPCPTPTGACRRPRSASSPTPRCSGCAPTTSTSTSATATTPTRRSRRRWRRSPRSCAQGKARYIGFSEWTADQIQAALAIPGVERFVSSQPEYSMLWRKPEPRSSRCASAEGIGQIVWSPLAQGALTGKYQPGAPPPAGLPGRQRVDGPDDGPLPGRRGAGGGAAAAARSPTDLGLSMAQLALAWVLRQPNVASAIIGASRPEQVDDNVAAVGRHPRRRRCWPPSTRPSAAWSGPRWGPTDSSRRRRASAATRSWWCRRSRSRSAGAGQDHRPSSPTRSGCSSSLLLLREPRRCAWSTSPRGRSTRPSSTTTCGSCPTRPTPGERLHLVAVGDPSIGTLSEKLLRPARRPRPRLREPRRSRRRRRMLPFNVTPAEQAWPTPWACRSAGRRPTWCGWGRSRAPARWPCEAGVAGARGARRTSSRWPSWRRPSPAIRARRPRRRGGGGQAQQRVLGPGQRHHRARRPGRPAAGVDDHVLRRRGVVADVRGQDRRPRAPSSRSWCGCDGLRSPSVQLRIAPGGEVEVLSTHDQILGGPESQVYLGLPLPGRARLPPGHPGRGAAGWARCWPARGSSASFGIDFLVTPAGRRLPERDQPAHGRHHPPVLDGPAGHRRRLRPGSGRAAAPAGSPACYVATDNLKSDRLVGRTPAEVIGLRRRRRPGLRPRHRHGGHPAPPGRPPRRHGKMGVTCIADSPEAADDLYAESGGPALGARR